MRSWKFCRRSGMCPVKPGRSIEQNNSDTRHHLGRFARRTKAVSKSKEMVDLTIRLCQPDVFAAWQENLHLYT
jgi:IS1 family transposase